MVWKVTEHYDRGLDYERKEDFVRAIRSFTYIIDRPKEASIDMLNKSYYHRALCCGRLNDYNSAIGDCTIVIDSKKASAEMFEQMYYLRAVCFERTQRFTGAMSDLKMVLNANSNSSSELREEFCEEEDVLNALDRMQHVLDNGHIYKLPDILRKRIAGYLNPTDKVNFALTDRHEYEVIMKDDKDIHLSWPYPTYAVYYNKRDRKRELPISYNNDMATREQRTKYFRLYMLSKKSLRRPFVLKGLKRYTFISEFMHEAVKVDDRNLEYACDRLKSDRQFILMIIDSCKHSVLHYVPDSLKRDRGIILKSVRHHGTALMYADPALRNDKDIVVEAVKNDVKSVYHASNALKSDHEFMMRVVKMNGGALRYASDELRHTHDIVMAAVQHDKPDLKGSYGDKSCLKYASTKCKSDRSIVLAAAKHNHLALKYANPNLDSVMEIKRIAKEHNVTVGALYEPDQELIIVS